MASTSGSGPLIFAPPPSPPPTPLTPEASLSTQERLRLAKKRRAAQLKRWHQRERGGGQPLGENLHSERPDLLEHTLPHHELGKGVIFVPSVMLLEAASRNDVEEVRRLLEMGVSPDSTNEDGLTALHQCCIDDSEEMMKVLLDYGGNPNATDTEKWTPLHAAATCGHLHLVKFLIDHGADLLAVNADGNMPYDLCEDETTLSYIENEMAKRGVTQELIDETRGEIERRMLRDLEMAGEDWLEARDALGATPLHVAAANGYLQVVEYLLDHHVSTEVVDLDQWQPIHAAACWGHLEVVELLAQNGANIMAKSKSGETPFDICEDPDIKDRLVQLKEQRVRQEQPKVRRTRSASTRTQSIRRTSLREKMNTTKRDVQDEKFFLMKTLDVIPKKDGSKAKESNAPLDVKDVELTIRSGYSPTEEIPTRPPRPTRDGPSGRPVLPEKPASKHTSSNQNPPRSPQRSAKDSAHHRNSQKNARQRSVQGGQEGVSKYSSDDPGEVVGAPSKKHGCCTLL
ncbi:protein phosphatase 1 regulatory subunit 16A-like isoform X2 [Tigriopus californicus]|uniref:protein phosphatase 1 regulatory subunit 16A-like isoform X2 n=1 Tax=Tigriopus californicus TaxID=6832 RepID=UPI0027DA899D|nr:protein phosphatase 1 regulatory subunit 16A-like isoform X2 [Tigriopus californicus]